MRPRGYLFIAFLLGLFFLVFVSSRNGTDASWLPPSFEHVLGTDEFGRDVLTATVTSTLNSVAKGIGLTVAAIAAASVVAYLAVVQSSRWMNWLLRGVTSVVESIPVLLWVLTAIVTIADPRWLVVTLAFTVAALPMIATVIAGELERLLSRPYVEAARLLGASELRILGRYITPNALSVLAPLGIQVLGAAIAVDGAIGLLGLGNRSDYDLGVMLLRGKENFLTRPIILCLALAVFVILYSSLEILAWRIKRHSDHQPSASRVDQFLKRYEQSKDPPPALLRPKSRPASIEGGGASLLSVSSLSLIHSTTGKLIVDSVSFDIRPREIFALVGESGSGKTSIALALMQLLPLYEMAIASGSIRVQGVEVLALTEMEMSGVRGAVVGMVFQEPLSSLNPVVWCGVQAEDPLRFHTNLTRRQRRRRVIEAFELVSLKDPERIYRSFPSELSGGQRQRVLFAMAMAMKPQLLVCDEPTTALDAPTKAEIEGLIRELRATAGVSVLLISHDTSLVSRIADRVAVLKNGRLVKTGPVDTVFADVISTGPLGDQRQREVANSPRTGLSDIPLVEAHDLWKSFPATNGLQRSRSHVVALDHVSIAIADNESVGLVGESGCGKTTLARCLCGLTTPDGGTVHVRGTELRVGRGSRIRPLPSTMQMIFQDPYLSLNPAMRVGTAIAEGVRARDIEDQDVRDETLDILDRVGLDRSYYHRLPTQLSGGERQRVAIARAAIARPSLLIADEPVSAIDYTLQSVIIALILELQREYGMSLLLISHDIDLIARTCDRILVMFEGRIVEEGMTDRVLKKPTHPYTAYLISTSRSPLMS